MGIRRPHALSRWITFAVVILMAGIAWGLSDRWLPVAQDWISSWRESAAGGHANDDRNGQGQDDSAHGGLASLTLSERARRNIGLSSENVREVTLETYRRTITMPAAVVEQPGRTKIQIAAPMTGVVTGIYAAKGEAVSSGDLLFRLRLTHEDLVRAQTTFLQTLGELDVESREIARLEKIASGVVAGKVLLQRQYERQKLEAVLSAYREALLLHGLSEEQVSAIASERRLLRGIEVFVPSLHHDSSLHDEAEQIHPTGSSAGEPSPNPSKPHVQTHDTLAREFIVQQLDVHKGQAVQAGNSLCVLADFSELYIEGLAFEQDGDEIEEAAGKGWTVTAVREGNHGKPETIDGLHIVYLDNEVDLESRALRFYVGLTNEIVRSGKAPGGHRFIGWKFKPGQRLQLQVPVEEWPDRIVLPVDAVAKEGAEYFVFQENGDHFDRRPVHVEHRDQFFVVIANDGSLFPGDIVAFTGAHQMQMALKNQSGGGQANGHMH